MPNQKIELSLGEWAELEGLNQEALAKRLGCTRSYVSRVLSGQRKLSPTLAQKAVEISKGRVSLSKALGLEAAA